MKIKEIAVPIALMTVVASLLVPVPPMILDLLIVSNLLFALGLVALALQSTDSLKLSALPTILLLSTLFRLCLNVSTSRLILSRGQGGEMVEAFGSFVLQGNIGVGVVLFLMLTLIQFIVIAKGSERVAEVAARFTLDALPGKQMAIDADVRAGMYDMQTARIKRQELQTESRFYGALDGSMKFIKGDAIAGICIVIINITGGLIAGLMNGLSLSEAAHLYTILTVGDGLASQIPALLNSLAAGLVVTRVGQGQETSLSSEMLEQIFQSKGIFILAGATALGLGVVPGMPRLPLFLIGTGCFVGSFFSRSKENTASPVTVSREFFPLPTSLLEVMHAIPEHAVTLKQLCEQLREDFFSTTGILLPVIGLKNNSDLQVEKNNITVKVRGAIVGIFDLENKTVEEASLNEIFKRIFDLLKNNREEFIDDAHSKRLLDWYEGYQPDLVAALHGNNFISTTQFTELLRGLAGEGLALHPLDRIVQGILEMAPRVGTDRPLIDEVRVYMKRAIHHQIFQGKETIRAALIDAAFESELFLGEGEKEVMEPMIVCDLIRYIQSRTAELDAVITGKASRRLLAEVCGMYQLAVPIVSHAELLSHVTIEPVVKITRETICQGYQNQSNEMYAEH